MSLNTNFRLQSLSLDESNFYSNEEPEFVDVLIDEKFLSITNKYLWKDVFIYSTLLRNKIGYEMSQCNEKQKK